MTDQNTALAHDTLTEDTSEWRPHNVWENQVRERSPTHPARHIKMPSAKESWHPFAVWKRYIRR